MSLCVWQISGPEPSTPRSVAVPCRGTGRIPSSRPDCRSPGRWLPCQVLGSSAPRRAFTELKAVRRDGSPGPLMVLKATPAANLW